MFKLTATTALFLYGADAISMKPIADLLQVEDTSELMKCDPVTGLCESEDLQVSLELEKTVNLLEISKTAKPVDLQYWLLQNSVRTNPQAWVPYYQDMASKFKGKVIGNLRTREGKPAVDELVAALKKQKPVGQLKWNDNLMKAAKDWADIQGPTGGMGHVSKDKKSTPSTRIRKYMKWERTMGENIMYGSSDPLRILSAFLVDDGVASRGHRTNILKGAFAYTGLYTGKWRGTYQTVVAYTGSNTSFNYKGPSVAIPAKFG